MKYLSIVDVFKTFEGYEINTTPRNIRRMVREIRHEGAKCTKKGQSVRTVSPPRTAPKRRLSVPSDHTIGILWFVTAREAPSQGIRSEARIDN